jgi:hypothetical protein
MTDDPVPAPHSGNEAVAEPSASGLLEVPEFSAAPGGVKPDINQITPLPGWGPQDPEWDAGKHRAIVQAELARRLIWVLLVVLFLGAALLSTTRWTGIKPQDVASFFGIAFGAVVTLATAATSFWFGSQDREPRTRTRRP